MNRRKFLATSAALPLAAALPGTGFAQQLDFNPVANEKWRVFDVTTRVEILQPAGATQVWLPVPAIETGFQKAIDNVWSGNAHNAKLLRGGKYGAAMLYAEFDDGEKAPVVELRSRVATRDRAINFSARGAAVESLSDDERALYTAATEHVPTDGIVARTAGRITDGASTDVDKARAIYEWIVDNTFRDPKVKGCGKGDIRVLLETGYLGGKCADLNALFVGLARASELPARDMYGVRVAKSAFGYRSLGANTANITKAQHCRAEVYLSRYGWVPVDPADVRKVALEEKPEPIKVEDPLVLAVRPKLFGRWEMNWIGFNTANEIALPNAKGDKITFFMYPQAETGGVALDSLDPEKFRYVMTASEVAA
jgi:transglutaminase-like putative cysteine protease